MKRRMTRLSITLPIFDSMEAYENNRGKPIFRGCSSINGRVIRESGSDHRKQSALKR